MLNTKSPLDYALEAYDLGLKVFPLKPNSKLPQVEDWENWAKNATEKALRHFTNHNFALACGPSNVTAIDLDVKKGEDGYKSFNQIQKELSEDFPDTWKVRTPSGGLHIIYQGLTKTTAHKLGPGIDTRSKGGYIVLAGSTIDGKSYQSETEITLSPIPVSLENLIHERTKPSTLDESHLVLKGERNQTLTSLAGTMRSRGFNYNAILAALTVTNQEQLEYPLTDSEVTQIAKSISRYAPDHAAIASDFEAVPSDLKGLLASNIDPKTIPMRKWLMKNRFACGYTSTTISPGGLGKSILSMLDALSLSTGLPLSGFEVERKVSTLIYNIEDPIDELQRRMVALSIEHNIPLTELKRIHLISGRDNPLMLAKNGKNGVLINKNAMQTLINYIEENAVELLTVDPFVRSHEVNENDNMQIDKVAWCYQRIADRTGCAVHIIHHTRKQGKNDNGGIDSARGASALGNASRVCQVLNPMSEDEAARFGIPSEKRNWYIRMDNAKANLQPPAEKAIWYEKTSVNIPNGDTVGALRFADLKDLAAIKEEEGLKTEGYIIAKAWAALYKEGSLTSLGDAIVAVGGESFLTGYSEKRGKEKLIRLLREGHCVCEGALFSYVYNEEKRQKHYIVRQSTACLE